ncbi:MAG: oligosaccharide flippase family protein [Ignavibacteriales bacterium]|nr:oligosaccharide flippase family protein [Ignavibacteriales bacterium]
MLNKILELGKDTAVYGVSTIIGRFIGFLLVPFYTQVFTTEQFGIYSYVYTLFAFLNIIYVYGMDVAFMKYDSLVDGEEKKKIFSTTFITVLITSIILSIIFFALRFPISELLEIRYYKFDIVYFVILILLIDSLTFIPFADLRLRRKAKKFATIKILNIIINVTLNIILILVFKQGIEAIFIANLIASIFSLLALSKEILEKLKFKIDKAVLKRSLKFGIPYLPASLSAMTVQVIDVPILGMLTDESTVGIYRANYKLGIIMMLFVSMFQYAWQPFFLVNAKEKNAKEIFAKVLTIFVIVGGVICVFFSLFIEDVAQFEIFGRTIIGRDYLVGLIIVPLVLLGYFFNGIYFNFSAGIYIEEKTKYTFLVTGIGALVKIGINFLLIPVWGLMGAAFSTLISYMAIAFSQYTISQKFYKTNYEYSKVIKLLVLVFLAIGAYYLLFYFGEINLLIKLLVMLIFIGLIFVLRIINFKEISTILTNIFSKSEKKNII